VGHALKTFYVVLGCISLVLGAIGVVLPILPTTPFILLAAFCFSRGSERLHLWLRNSPVFGKVIRDWEEGGVIRLPAKITATLFIVVSFGWLTLFSRAPQIGKIILDILAVAVLAFIWSRPSAKVDVKGDPSWPST